MPLLNNRFLPRRELVRKHTVTAASIPRKKPSKFQTTNPPVSLSSKKSHIVSHPLQPIHPSNIQAILSRHETPPSEEPAAKLPSESQPASPHPWHNRIPRLLIHTIQPPLFNIKTHRTVEKEATPFRNPTLPSLSTTTPPSSHTSIQDNYASHSPFGDIIMLSTQYSSTIPTPQ